MSKLVLNPSRRTLFAILIIWFIGITLLILASTNLFTESIFQRKHTVTNSLIIGATSSIIVIIRNSIKNNK